MEEEREQGVEEKDKEERREEEKKGKSKQEQGTAAAEHTSLDRLDRPKIGKSPTVGSR